MSVNRVSMTINSRCYTVVADESVEYLERLGNHINEKVESVIKGGQNIIGERPVVLAALNICDEYFKAVQNNDYLKDDIRRLNEKNLKLQHSLNDLHKELDDVSSSQISIDESVMTAETDAAKKELDLAHEKIKSMEEHIKELENKIRNLQDRNRGRNNSSANNQKQGKRG